MNNVIHVVLVYRRETGELLVQESFADGDTAMRRRFELERVAEYAGTEVIVLSADSEQTLRETHGRYFYTEAELARQLRDALSAA
ncbi:hypothetical protein [Actinophytocola gossypii]|uniref:DUF5753 domain-containing protein n=1 Tax=Actinophytocola gossypii TaxID=2812003 RepID=A0ABT2JIF4_9PSEU|nr:hypothetical protein [Actinophytocola gossypii]MCT2587501.1 hypothetical protein [Actinophytocola gossypii]